MQVIWCLKFYNMTKSGGQSPAANSGEVPRTPPTVIYAHGCHVSILSGGSPVKLGTNVRHVGGHW